MVKFLCVYLYAAGINHFGEQGRQLVGYGEVVEKDLALMSG